MIKCDNGKVEINGYRVDLLFQLSMIMKSFIEKGVADKDDLFMAFCFATMSEDELSNFNKKISDVNKNLKKSIIEEIDKMDNIGDALNMLGYLESIMK